VGIEEVIRRSGFLTARTGKLSSSDSETSSTRKPVSPNARGLGRSGGTEVEKGAERREEVLKSVTEEEKESSEDGKMEEERSEVEELADDGDLSDQEDRVEEARVAVGRKSPKMPTKAEMEEHARTHLPYRSWCRHCVRSRARNSPHRRKVEEDSLKEGRVPRVHLDYFFMSKADEKGFSESHLGDGGQGIRRKIRKDDGVQRSRRSRIDGLVAPGDQSNLEELGTHRRTGATAHSEVRW